MGGGNAQKAKMAREKNLEKAKGSKGFIFMYLSVCIYFILIWNELIQDLIKDLIIWVIYFYRKSARNQ